MSIDVTAPVRDTTTGLLPQLIHYVAPVPPVRALPGSRADWSLDPSRAAVLVHDLQRYFMRPYDPQCPAMVAAIASTRAVLAAAREAGLPVFYTAQRGNQDQIERGLQRELWGQGMADVPEHTEILDEVAPVDGETVLVKHRYSAFQRSDLAERLAAAGRDQIVIVGVYAHIGITATAFEAFQREVQPFLVADAVADFSAAEHARALDLVAGCCGVVTRTADVVSALSPRDEGAAVAVTVPTQPTRAAAEVAPVVDAAWEAALTEALTTVLPDAADQAFAEPDADLFTMGLDSLRAFEALDILADAGVDIDFGAFTRRPTLTFLREQGAARGTDQP